MELYNANEMPLSNNPELAEAQRKVLSRASLTMHDRLILGRDHPVKELCGYELKPDHCYRAISRNTFDIYMESGYIMGLSEERTAPRGGR